MPSAVPALVAADSPLVEIQEALSDADILAGREEKFDSADSMMRAVWVEWRLRHVAEGEPASGNAESEPASE